MYQLLLKVSVWIAVLLQGFEFFYIIILKRNDEVLYMYYHTSVSIFAALIN